MCFIGYYTFTDLIVRFCNFSLLVLEPKMCIYALNLNFFASKLVICFVYTESVESFVENTLKKPNFIHIVLHYISIKTPYRFCNKMGCIFLAVDTGWPVSLLHNPCPRKGV